MNADPVRKSNPNLAPRWKPGQSGNPGGRPKGLSRAVRERLAEAAGEGRDGAEVLVGFWSTVIANTGEKTALRLAASKLLAEYGWGKPPEYAPIEGADPLEMSDVDRHIRELLDELAPRRAAKTAGRAEEAGMGAPGSS